MRFCTIFAIIIGFILVIHIRDIVTFLLLLLSLLFVPPIYHRGTNMSSSGFCYSVMNTVEKCAQYPMESSLHLQSYGIFVTFAIKRHASAISTYSPPHQQLLLKHHLLQQHRLLV